MNCEQVREQLDAYALGALDPDEHAAVEAHLSGCPECREEAAALLAVAHRLPEALAAASPHRLPPDLRSRVIASLSAQPSIETERAARPSAGDSPVASAGDPAHGERAARPGWWKRLGPAWQPRAIGALATVVLIASLAWSFHLSQVLGREQALRAEFEGLVDQQEIVLEVVDSDKTVKAILRPPAGSDSNAYGKLFTRPDLPHVVVMAARLPPPANGETYHLWLTDDGRTGLVGILNLNEDGFGMLVFDAPVNGPTYEAVALTLQPEGRDDIGGTTVLTWQATP